MQTDSIEGCLGGIANLKNKAEQRRIKLHEAKEAVRKVQERCDARSEPAPIGDLEQTAVRATFSLAPSPDALTGSLTADFPLGGRPTGRPPNRRRDLDRGSPEAAAHGRPDAQQGPAYQAAQDEVRPRSPCYARFWPER